jgi:hypothetical protein
LLKIHDIPNKQETSTVAQKPHVRVRHDIVPVCCRVKIHDMSNLQETSSVLTIEEDEVERLSWNEDGQLLGVVTHSGSIYVYLSQLPMVWSVYGTHLAVLTSLTEVTLYNYDQKVSNYNQEFRNTV